MKYGIWNTALPDSAAVDALQQAGYSPLTARVLAGRGCGTPQQAQELLCADAPLFDPFLLREMDRAVQTVRQALQLGQRIAVFGDYDVDGITATCLLTDFLRGIGADCVVHIPGRLEEGYGLNAGAIRQLHAQGVRLIITVDCGITALEEAELCRELGVTLVVTDHHECKEQLPQCAAVVDPHRPGPDVSAHDALRCRHRLQAGRCAQRRSGRRRPALLRSHLPRHDCRRHDAAGREPPPCRHGP